MASVPLNPPLQLEDGHLDTAAQTHISAPASVIYDSAAQSAALHRNPQICASDDKEKPFSAGYTFMKPVDLCSLDVPRGDYYTAENHYCNITCIVSELIWVMMSPYCHSPLPPTLCT